MTQQRLLFVVGAFLGRSTAMLLVVYVAGLGAIAQTPQFHGKATELVVARYEKLISNGALLTPEGWSRAASSSSNRIRTLKRELSFSLLQAVHWPKCGRKGIERK